jgi:hypothetical protein
MKEKPMTAVAGSRQSLESRVRVRHEAYGCNERVFHSPFQVGDVPLERSGQERFPDGERAAPKRSGEMELGHQDARLGKATIW